MAKRVLLLLIGGLGFWAPAVVFEILSRGRHGVVFANLAPVALTVVALSLLRRGRLGALRTLPLWILAGIYLLCPLAVTTATSAFGGGFATFVADDVRWLLLASVFPPLGLVMAGYNGTLLGLLAETLILTAATIWPNKASPAGRPT